MRTVLVVDDSPDVGLVLVKLLEKCGYRAAFESTAGAALKAATIINPDVVFIDLGMPDMNGYELAQKFREQAKNGKPKLVSLTGYPRGKGNGDDSIFDEYLLKPVDARTLRRVIEDQGGPQTQEQR